MVKFDITYMFGPNSFLQNFIWTTESPAYELFKVSGGKFCVGFQFLSALLRRYWEFRMLYHQGACTAVSYTAWSPIRLPYVLVWYLHACTKPIKKERAGFDWSTKWIFNMMKFTRDGVSYVWKYFACWYLGNSHARISKEGIGVGARVQVRRVSCTWSLISRIGKQAWLKYDDFVFCSDSCFRNIWKVQPPYK